MNTKQMTIWFSTISIILVLWGIVFAFFGLDILQVMNKEIIKVLRTPEEKNL